MYAASFVMGDNWKTCRYISSADVMSGGEQVIMTCVSSLCGALLGFEAGKEASIEFLKASSNILFIMKAEESGKYSAYPIRAMFVLLERFVEVSPFVDRSVLEKYMPYTILHAAYVDMSLNKQRVGDVGMDSKHAFVSKKAVSADA